MILNKFNKLLYKLSQSKNKLDNKDEFSVVIQIIKPILDRIEGRLSANTLYDEDLVIEYLKKKYHNWKDFIDDLNSLINLIESKDKTIELKHFRILDDIANAIQIESGALFQKLRIYP